MTHSAPGLAPGQALATITGSSTQPNTTIKRSALVPENTANKLQPWLREQVGVAVATPGPLAVTWDLFPTDQKLAQRVALPVTVRVQRAAGSTGAVRLRLVTTQTTPRKRVKIANQDREVDDVERTLRFEGEPTIAAEQNQAGAKILVPAD